MIRGVVALSTFVAVASLLAAPAADPPAFAWPYQGPNTFRQTAGFDLDPATSSRADWTGFRTGDPFSPAGNAYDGHGGSDTGLPTGTNIYSAATGTVNSLRESVPNDDHSDTGNYLILNHTINGIGYRSLYWHLSQNGVIPTAVGQAVTKSQLVAASDNTGNSTGPHLHYGINRSGSDVTCPFYNGWWEQDEFYYDTTRPCLTYITIAGDPLNCREGNSTAYNILTSFPINGKAVASHRSGWWRVYLPLPPATAYESRTAAGALSTGYSEAGSWSNSATKSTIAEVADDANRTLLVGSGSRFSTFVATGDAADVATQNFTVPFQRGNYDLYATWPSDANAANVTYQVTDSNGTQNIVINQTPASSVGAGTGTKADPYRIIKSPYVVNHTTVGAPDEWNSYSPTGSGIAENGPERLYRFDLTATCNVKINVVHTGYPTLDIDLHLLNAPANTACIARGDYYMNQSLAAGTYYIAADSYGTTNNAATAYTLRVEFDGPQPLANSWVKLGSFFYAAGAGGSVSIREQSVTGKVDGALPGRVYADAIKLVPRITRRSGWISDTFSTRINMASAPVPSVLIKTDKTAYNDSDDIDEYSEVPIYASAGAGTTNSSAIVGKAVTGQRYVVIARAGDWYRVHLTNGTAATSGWLLGDHLIGYRQNLISAVTDWSLY